MPTLYDAYGRPVQPAELRSPLDREWALRYTVSRFDYPGAGLTPDRLTAVLREADEGRPQRLQELYGDMEDRDGHLLSVLAKRRLAVVGRGVRLVAAAGGKKAQVARDFCQELTDAIPDFEEALVTLLSAVFRGYTCTEIRWEITDREVWVTELREWDHRLFLTVAEDPYALRRMTEQDMARGIELEPGRWLVLRYRGKSGLPVRAGLGRVLAWYHMFGLFALKDWLDFAEIFGQPPRLGYFSPTTSPEDRAVLERVVRLFSRDLAAVVPEGTRIEFPEVRTGAATSDLYERLHKLCNSEKSKAVLGQTLTTEQGERGARSLGEVHERVEGNLIRSDARALASALRRDLYTSAVRWRLGEDYPVPLVFIDTEDLGLLAQRVELLVKLGLPVGRRYLYERFDLPAPADDEPVVGAAGAGEAGGALGAAPRSMREGQRREGQLEAGEKKSPRMTPEVREYL